MALQKYLNSLSLILLCLVISSCGVFNKEPQIVTVTEFVKPDILIQNHPKPVILSDVEWYVVSEKNYDEFIERFEKENGQLVFVATTVKGYENMSINLQEIRRYLLQQQQIITYYEKVLSEDVIPAENN